MIEITPKLSSSRVRRSRGIACHSCGSRDVRGQPSPAMFKRYRSFACGACGVHWTSGHRGYVRGQFP